MKLHIRPQEQISRRNLSAITVFEEHMEQSIKDFELHADLLDKAGQLSNRTYKKKVSFKFSDSKKSIQTPTNQPFFDLLVTSPPYGDNKTTVPYGQNSYLPLQWIDLHDIDIKATKELLKSASEIDSRSLGGKLGEITQEKLDYLLAVSNSFCSTYKKIKNKSEEKVSKVVAFIQDLNETIDNIFGVIKDNSYQIWTIGNRRVAEIEIPNDQILTDLMEAKGAKLIKQVEREIINKRMGRRNKETSLMNTEDILIFRKIGK